MRALYEAIVEIDKSLSKNSEDTLDEVLNAVKDIDKKKYPKEFTNTIVSAIRESLVVLYKEQQAAMNEEIGFKTEYFEYSNGHMGSYRTQSITPINLMGQPGYGNNKYNYKATTMGMPINKTVAVTVGAEGEIPVRSESPITMNNAYTQNVMVAPKEIKDQRS